MVIKVFLFSAISGFVAIIASCSSPQIGANPNGVSGLYRVVAYDSTLMPQLLIFNMETSSGDAAKLVSRINSGVVVDTSEFAAIKTDCWYQLDLWPVLGLSADGAFFLRPAATVIYSDGRRVLDIDDPDVPVYWSGSVYENHVIPGAEVSCE